jgi:hypothetical protein
MNHITHRNRLEKQMFKYINFLPLAQSDYQINKIYNQSNPTFMILDEIQYLKFKIMQINQMTSSKAIEDIHFKEYIFKSSINNQ